MTPAAVCSFTAKPNVTDPDSPAVEALNLYDVAVIGMVAMTAPVS